jgi:DNA polymerase III delta prime subunit
MLTPYLESGVPVDRQEKLLQHVVANPLDSYVFSGPPGVGKTTLMNEVERLARKARGHKNHYVYSRTATRYQRDATAYVMGDRRVSVVKAEDFEIGLTGIQFSIFLDDLDKITGSEFIQLQLHDLIDTIVKPRKPANQLVITTNMRKDEVAKFFGGAIYWRVHKYCHWVALERGDV